MENSLLAVLDIVTIILGILFGLISLLRIRSNPANLYLGLFLITYVLEMSVPILSETGFLEHYPYLFFLPLNFYYLTLPLFYLYTKSLINPIKIKNEWPFLMPGAIELFMFSFMFLKAIELGEVEFNMIASSAFETYERGSILFSIFFALLVIRMVNRHQKEVLNYYSNLENKHLSWIKQVSIFICTTYLFWLVADFIFDNHVRRNWLYSFLSVLNNIFILWVSITGFRQQRILMNFESDASVKSYLIETSEFDSIYKRLVELMEETKPFKDCSLTLPLLAKQLNISKNQLSKIINERVGKNFNWFINYYRVEEAKKLLVNSNYDHLNLMGIASEIGFNSKATFFAVFKQFEQLTPGAYKKKLQAEKEK